MYTYLEVFGNEGLDAYYVQFRIENGQILLEKPNGFSKALLHTIPLNKLSQPFFDTYLGNVRFSFSYLDDYYIFHESSPGLTNYINQQLALTT